MENFKQGREKTFVGFGLGAVQAGLFLNEAQKSGNFSRFVVVEINRELVKSVRKNNSSLMLNTANKDGIVRTRLSDIEILDPNDPADQPLISEAVQSADELATAIPSVNYYNDGGKHSIAAVLANNINPLKPQILYAAENNNFAAEILVDTIIKHGADRDRLSRFQVLNTVIGKMGGLISEKDIIDNLNLDPIVPGFPHAFLVEAFNHIIISKINLENYQRGIEVFEEKPDLLPFEEAKLFGHNTVHSLLGYVAYFKNYTYMSQIRHDKQLYEIGRETFKNECGASLCRKHAALGESLFTEKGFAFYGEDLLDRMTNPNLNDKVSRICRDPGRKLGYHDRFFGAMKEALQQHIRPVRMAQGAVAALSYVIAEKMDVGFALPASISDLDRKNVKNLLIQFWKGEADDAYQEPCLDLVEEVFDPFMNMIS